jgi:hypothetical protein
VSHTFKPGKMCRVVVAHQNPFPDPLVFRTGDTLKISDRYSEWRGWVWCTNDAGKSGWVPEAYLEQTGDTGVARRDYDATELSAAVGEELTVYHEESGWLWCSNQNGQNGWIPADNVELL